MRQHVELDDEGLSENPPYLASKTSQKYTACKAQLQSSLDAIMLLNVTGIGERL